MIEADLSLLCRHQHTLLTVQILAPSYLSCPVFTIYTQIYTSYFGFMGYLTGDDPISIWAKLDQGQRKGEFLAKFTSKTHCDQV